MSSTLFCFAIVLLKFIDKHQVYSVPTCIIIDTNQPYEEEIFPNNRSSSSKLLRNLRMLDHQRSSNSPIEPYPLSYIDIKQKSSTEPKVERTYSPCALQALNKLETHMVVPFEFRRLRIEQPDHQTKFLDEEQHETLPDLSTAVYERRSDPDGVQFCRTCHDGLWSELSACETVRCDAELLRANPRLVTEWGEIKPIDGGALYGPSTIFAIYAFAFGPHCKRCESNGQWSHYALPEFCSGIKFFGHSTTTTMKNLILNTKQSTTISLNKLINKKQ